MKCFTYVPIPGARPFLDRYRPASTKSPRFTQNKWAASALVLRAIGDSSPHFARRANQKRLLPSTCPPPFQKIFRFALTPNQNYIHLVPPHMRGVCAIVTDVGCGMRWTRRRRADERCQSGRRSRVVLTPRRWCQVGDDASHRADDGGKKARSPRRARRKPLKPSACGNAGLLR